MINALTGLGYGIIAFAVLIGIGIVILGQLSSTVAGCATGFTYQANSSTTFTTNLCCLTDGEDCTSAGNYTSPSTASQNMNTIGETYIGTNLVGWIPVVIVLVIGMLFLGAFMAKKGSQS